MDYKWNTVELQCNAATQLKQETMAPTGNPFSYLKQTVNVLVVDDMPEFLFTMKDFLEEFGLYSVYTASSTAEAVRILSNPKQRIHVGLLDRGMSDVERNEFYLLDKFGKKIPFIIMTARADDEKAFECKERGAMAYIKKDSPVFYSKLMANLNKQALLNMICPKYPDNRHSILCDFMDTLIEKRPQHVNTWAMEANVSDRHMRREWEERLGVNAKHVLCIFHLFSMVFALIEKEAQINPDTDPAGDFFDDPANYNRFREYFLLNQHAILSHVFRPAFAQ
jgi:CheY-like chemotaxis protein